MRNFKQIFSKMKEAGLAVPQETFSIQIPDAKTFFCDGMKAILEFESKEFKWIPEYDEIINWLADSKGKCLFMYGNCGRGKSLIARYLIPAAISEYYNRLFFVTDAIAFAQNIDDVIQRRFIVIDDIGTEDFTNEYGSKRLAFAELMDQAEKHNKLIVLTSNLNVEQLKEKYGDRTVERIVSTCCRVCFTGKSLRS